MPEPERYEVLILGSGEGGKVVFDSNLARVPPPAHCEASISSRVCNQEHLRLL